MKRYYWTWGEITGEWKTIWAQNQPNRTFSVHFGNWTLKYQCPYLWNKISNEIIIDTNISKKTFAKQINEFFIKDYGDH